MDEGCPKTLKQDSIELLENAKDGELCSRWKNIGGGCHDKELDKVINYIKKSLEQSYWDSEVEVNSKKVFDYEMLAVTHCLRGPFKNLDPACGEAAGNLVEADRVIANTTLETAKSLIVQNPKNQKCFDQETKKAELFYDEATNKISRKYQSLAILNYRLSWEHSQKATEYATTNRRTCGGWS